MPEQFDPAWEYWTPDPDIAEMMGFYRADGFDCLGVETEHGDWIGKYRRGGLNYGFRVDWGNPDAVFIDPDPSPVSIGPPPTYKSIRRAGCGCCGRGFDVTRFRKNLCPRCCPSSGSPRWLDDVECGWCGVKFRPPSAEYKYCGKRCFDEWQRNVGGLRRAERPSPGPRGRPRTLPYSRCDNEKCGGWFRPSESGQRYCGRSCRYTCASIIRERKIDMELLMELLKSGESQSAIADRFGVSSTAVRTATKKLRREGRWVPIADVGG